VGERNYLQPHVRYYNQTAAKFYRHSLVAGEALPEFVSGDYRVGSLEAVTGGSSTGS